MKIILLIILFLSLGGCYDYNEINDLAIIVGIGIDYKDDKYLITYEILSNNKDKESANISAYTVSASDKILANALDNTSDRIAKKAYYAHADLVIISKEIAQNHFNEITDYLLRSNYIRDNFNIVIAEDPKKLLEEKQDNLPVISNSINETLAADLYSGAYSLDKEFADIIREILTFGCDTTIPLVNVVNDKIYLQGIALFDDYKMINTLNKNESAIFNIITNKSNKTTLTKEYDNKDFTISILPSNIKIEVSKNKIIISGKANAKIINNEPNFFIKNSKTLNKIEKDFEQILNKKVKELILKLQKK